MMYDHRHCHDAGDKSGNEDGTICHRNDYPPAIHPSPPEIAEQADFRLKSSAAEKEKWQPAK
jgi:hypothetical protein